MDVVEQKKFRQIRIKHCDLQRKYFRKQLEDRCITNTNPQLICALLLYSESDDIFSQIFLRVSDAQ